MIAGAMSGRETMIVLDNCEHLLDECAAFVQAVLAASTAMRLLATSREPLGVPGEVVYSVRPLQLAAGDEGWDRIARCEAVRLFTSRASAARPGFVATADDAQLVLAICRRVDGLPLAIELAAARAASMSLHDLAASLDDRFRLLDSAVRTADARHRSLATTMAWSYALLTNAERALFVRVGVFPAAFDLRGANAVAGGDEHIESHNLRGGTALVVRSNRRSANRGWTSNWSVAFLGSAGCSWRRSALGALRPRSRRCRPAGGHGCRCSRPAPYSTLGRADFKATQALAKEQLTLARAAQKNQP
jgi:hypothetical protein